MKQVIVYLFLLLSGYEALAQGGASPFIRLTDPYRYREDFKVSSDTRYISGVTCKQCELTLNGEAVKVYATGAFACELNFKPGDNTFRLVATSPAKTKAAKRLSFYYSIPVPDTVKTLDIASIEVDPQGELFVRPGDRIRFKVKALSGCQVVVNGDIPLYEMPDNPMPGIYQGEYIVKETDNFSEFRFPVRITNEEGKSLTKSASGHISMVNKLPTDMLVSKGRLAHLLFGLGEDRLGGAKIGYIDSLIPMRIIGKVDSNYKVRLSKYRTAYIPSDLVSFLPRGTFTPSSLTGDWRVYGDSLYDYVSVRLFTRLPYQSFQLVDPSRIVVDVFGATNNTNWITQLENTREIRNVYYEQIEDEVLRITIELKHTQQWGYDIYYSGNKLMIKVRRQPERLSLKNLEIAVDAGHGGSNTGASGPTGVYEKNLTLAVSLKLEKALEQEGARVIMTRTKEKYFDNKERILFYRDSLPDLLLSLHLNSSGDPVHVGGVSTYYRHIGFRNLSQSVYRQMLKLGLKDYGNVGSFNFMLNSPTEYPNALVEMLFLSNPEEEMMILDEGFQQQIADSIVAGIKDFLSACD